MESRKERRDAGRVQVLLSSLAQPLLSEQASTEDHLTSYGIRVQTERPWELGTTVVLKTSKGEPLARARVVYCNAVERKIFQLGLNFLGRTAAWNQQ